MVYALALKSYLGFSSRRVVSDLIFSKELEKIDKEFHFNTLLKYLDNPGLKPLLKEMIEISALPLKQVELDFAVDSTGFGTSVYSHWYDFRFGNKKNVSYRHFRKCHAISGVRTNIISSVEITKGTASDAKQFPYLVRRTSKNWDVREISADKAYSSKVNLKLVKDLGAIPFIPFKSNTTGKGMGIWAEMYRYFKDNQEEFNQHYHKRSNVESSFMMIKARFGGNVRCKKEISQDNEILLKCLCHNICVLVQEMFMSHVNVDFQKCAKVYVAHK
jgi:transposase